MKREKSFSSNVTPASANDCLGVVNLKWSCLCSVSPPFQAGNVFCKKPGGNSRETHLHQFAFYQFDHPRSGDTGPGKCTVFITAGTVNGTFTPACIRAPSLFVALHGHPATLAMFINFFHHHLYFQVCHIMPGNRQFDTCLLS